MQQDYCDKTNNYIIITLLNNQAHYFSEIFSKLKMSQSAKLSEFAFLFFFFLLQILLSRPLLDKLCSVKKKTDVSLEKEWKGRWSFHTIYSVTSGIIQWSICLFVTTCHFQIYYRFPPWGKQDRKQGTNRKWKSFSCVFSKKWLHSFSSLSLKLGLIIVK